MCGLLGGPTRGTLAIQLLTGKGTPGGTSTTLPSMHEGPRLHRPALSCKQNSCSSSLVLEKEMTGEIVCINDCRRRSKPSAIAEDVPGALLCYMGC